jgi:hypothetical protein
VRPCVVVVYRRLTSIFLFHGFRNGASLRECCDGLHAQAEGVRRAESVPFGTDGDVAPEWGPGWQSTDITLNLLVRRAMGGDLHDVRLVLSQPGIDAPSVCF